MDGTLLRCAIRGTGSRVVTGRAALTSTVRGGGYVRGVACSRHEEGRDVESSEVVPQLHA
eukprot:1031997-Rhodomonas_salina.2